MTARSAGPTRAPGAVAVPPARPSVRPSVPLLVAALCASPVLAAPPVARTLEGVPVSGAQIYTQMTPIAVHGGEVYLATIEPGPSGDGPRTTDLRIVVRRGVPDGAGGYAWSESTVEERGVYDPWHTAPSVGVDPAGHVHVAYNMHNFPWQYSVSTRPGDITEFEFRGQAMTQAELDRHTFENKTSFPDLGSAAIPGNQVTYPAFENDRSGQLYVTYRFAAKPGRAFAERTYSSGVARYDAATRAWRPLGGLLEYGPGDHAGPAGPEATLRAVASESGWTSYQPRLSFGPDDAVTLSTMWRDGTAGRLVARPCVVRSVDGESFETADGAPVAVPLRPAACPNVATASAADYYSLGDSAADRDGHPLLLLSPVGGKREIHRWDGARWTVERAPGAAVEIFFDDRWNLWAIAQGLSVYLKRDGRDEWENVVLADATTECLPHAALDPADRSVAHVFSMGCDVDEAAVTRLDLAALRGDAPADDPPAGEPPADDPPADDDPPDAAAFSVPPLRVGRLEWHQISLPFTGPDLSPAAAFGDALPGETYRQRWFLYGHDAAGGTYFEPGAGEPLEPGRGYWLIHDFPDEVVLGAPADAAPVPSVPSAACAAAACTEVPLAAPAAGADALGWNLGGVPAARAVALADVRVADAGDGCGTGCTLTRAYEEKVFGFRLFHYSPALGDYVRLETGDAAEPWVGWWGATLSEADAPTLLFPDPAAGGPSGRAKAFAAPAAFAASASAPEARARPKPAVVSPRPAALPDPGRGPTPENRALDGA